MNKLTKYMICLLLLLLFVIPTKIFATELTNETNAEEITYEPIKQDELDSFLKKFYFSLSEKNTIQLKEYLDKEINYQDLENTGTLIDYELLDTLKANNEAHFVQTKVKIKSSIYHEAVGETKAYTEEFESDLFVYLYVYKENGQIKVSFDKFYEHIILYPDFMGNNKDIFDVIYKVKHLEWSKIDVKFNNEVYEKKYSDKQISEMIQTESGRNKLKKDLYYEQLLAIYDGYYFGSAAPAYSKFLDSETFDIYASLDKRKAIEVKNFVGLNINNYFFSSQMIPLKTSGITLIKNNETNEMFLPIYTDDITKPSNIFNIIFNVFLFIVCSVILFTLSRMLMNEFFGVELMDFLLHSSTRRAVLDDIRAEREANRRYMEEERLREAERQVNSVTNLPDTIHNIINDNNPSNEKEIVKEEDKIKTQEMKHLDGERKIVVEKGKEEKPKEVKIESKRKIDFENE